ncbi:MAG: hypothetical protein AAGU27_09335 [Dehalobacterium sp.]
MTKKIAIIARLEKRMHYYKELLTNILGDSVEMEGYAIENNKIDRIIDADLVVMAFHSLY